MARNELLSRSFMLMNFAAAALLIMTQWRNMPKFSANPAAVAGTPVVTAVEQDLSGSTASGTQARSSPAHSAQAAPAAPSPANAPASPSPDAAANAVRLVVDLSDRQVYLYKWNKVQATYPVGVGQPGWETPTGTFNVNHMESNPIWQHPITGQTIPAGEGNPLGSRWIGFATTEQYEIGFHATNQPSSVGKAVSHGCLRMHEADIQEIYSQVGIGTTVTVRP